MNPRLVISILLSVAVLTGCGKEDIPTGPVTPPPTQAEKHGIDYLYDGVTVPEMHISVSTAQWNRLLNAYDKDSNTKESVPCDVTYIKNGEKTVVIDAGLRLKGNTSRRRPEGNSGENHRSNARWRHFHMQVNFHKYVKDEAHKVHGAQKVTLKWFKDDPAYVRELYCYDLFRRSGCWTGANSTYCRVFIRIDGDLKETYLGVYHMIEPIDDDYLEVRKEQFGSAGGNLWRCRWGARLDNPGAHMGPDLDDGREYQYELKTNTDQFDAAKAQLQDFIRNFNSLRGEEFLTWFLAHCDSKLLMDTYAVNVAVGMWDDYWNNCNNFYIYFNSRSETDYKFYFIPYDYDNSLGTCVQCGVQSDAGRQDPFHWGVDDNVMMPKLLGFTNFRLMYRDALLRLIEPSNGLLDMQASAARICEWQNSVAGFVPNDTGEDMTVKDRPASWSNHGEYRIVLTGPDNFFAVKAESIKKYTK